MERTVSGPAIWVPMGMDKPAETRALGLALGKRRAQGKMRRPYLLYSIQTRGGEGRWMILTGIQKKGESREG